MTETTKYTPIPITTTSQTNPSPDFNLTKTLFQFRTKKTRAFAYVFILVFIAVTVFLAFNPSPNSSSPWFSNIFSVTTNPHTNSSTNSVNSVNSVRSQFSSIYSYFFAANSTKSVHKFTFDGFNRTVKRNESRIGANSGSGSANIAGGFNKTVERNESAIGAKTGSGSAKIGVGDSGLKAGLNSVNKGLYENKLIDVKDLVKCDLFDGEWVKDESYPLFKPGSCSLIDEQFNCYVNGRPDKGFQMLRWKPKGCSLPRLDGSNMLQMLRGKRLVFVGDSLNRNMWESLICILRNSVKDQLNVYEASGRHHFRSEPSYSFVFKDYNCTVEFFVAPFIVRESETKDKNGTMKETLRLDLIGTSADQYKNADIVVFNTGHWWTHDKTAKGKDYYQEGSHVYSELNVLEAFRKAMTTWGRWVDANINPSKTSVFFRGYSASHFRGGQWNSGGQCDNEVEPIKNTTYLSPYPDKMKTLERVLRGMKTQVTYLNITRLTDFRKDGHPSIYRKQHYSEEERKSPLHFQDCSHWCLPGVPDSWNEILYAELLIKQYQNQQQKH
ncbi:PMR5 N-terminal domain, PC-Esterase, Trichome birefringence/trichome birefringence-like 1 [Artemisia annua]|uniref:PMR5 N-terminal domain, PC-Esterase, Trichome birefringence/trichome birefringence-like 1 n=1 Tax=Artemisia annua TaxID=35608 RepID=A0A2U1N020_ARTAN|nr:PMR5 N-terminal domain, PC-Esterase, Trichome birefringence/trichome birefringence-like 1 [Artemisia annua]